MRQRSSLIAAITLALCIGQAVAAGDPSTLEERMSGAQFRAAGLDKLSPEELASLNQWLREHGATGTVAMPTAPVATTPAGTAAPAAAPVAPAVADRNGFNTPETPRTAINDRIKGTFRGWSGTTLFRLENGQVWQQAEPDGWKIERESPKVEIRPKMMGSWMLRIEGFNRSVRVKRIQ